MKTSLKNPERDTLLEILHYNRVTGVLMWKKSGKESGCVSRNGYTFYRRVKINGKLYMAHRIIWTMVYRVDPGLSEIDHKDGDGLNNKINNLRRVTPGVNRRNLIRKRRIQQAGVYWDERLQKYAVSGKDNGTQIHIGVFTSENEAVMHRLLFDKKVALKTNDKVLLAKCDRGLTELNAGTRK